METPLDLRVSELLELLADRRRVPGAGTLAALTTAAAAAIVARAARFSTAVWPEADGAAAQARALRRRAESLASLGAEAFARAVDLLDEPSDSDADRRNWQLGQALAGAAEVPLQIADTAADVAALAAEVAERGSEELRPDVAAAAALAEAAARIGAHLVAINLSVSASDERVRGADARAEAATACARRALARA